MRGPFQWNPGNHGSSVRIFPNRTGILTVWWGVTWWNMLSWLAKVLVGKRKTFFRWTGFDPQKWEERLSVRNSCHASKVSRSVTQVWSHIMWRCQKEEDAPETFLILWQRSSTSAISNKPRKHEHFLIALNANPYWTVHDSTEKIARRSALTNSARDPTGRKMERTCRRHPMPSKKAKLENV